MPSRAAGIFIVLAAAVMWSFGGLAVKAARMDPIAYAFGRSVIASLGMAALLGLSAGRRPPLRWMALTATLYTGTVTLLIIAMTAGTAAAGMLLQNTAPVFCALFAWLFQRRPIAQRTLLAIAVAVGGIAIMVAGARADGGMVAPACGLTSGICYAALILVLQKADRIVGGRANPFYIVLCNNVGATLILLPFWLAHGAPGASAGQLAIVAAAGIFQVGLPYVIFQVGLRRVHPVDASLLVLLEPVLNPTWVWMAGIETPGLVTFIGGAAILAALLIDAMKPGDRSA